MGKGARCCLRCYKGLTQGPASIVAGRHVLQVDAASLHVLNGQSEQLLKDRLQVGRAYTAQIPNQGKGTLANIGRGVLAALGQQLAQMGLANKGLDAAA